MTGPGFMTWQSAVVLPEGDNPCLVLSAGLYGHGQDSGYLDFHDHFNG
jgi:hypothetical protein